MRIGFGELTRVDVEDGPGHNEAVFRDVNERIEQGQWPGERGAPVAFRCECSNLGCNLLVEMTLDEYEHARADPRHFVLVPGREPPEVEVVVERRTGYVIVEKVGRAGGTVRLTFRLARKLAQPSPGTQRSPQGSPRGTARGTRSSASGTEPARAFPEARYERRT